MVYHDGEPYQRRRHIPIWSIDREPLAPADDDVPDVFQGKELLCAHGNDPSCAECADPTNWVWSERT
jgi:hypothetical protein